MITDDGYSLVYDVKRNRIVIGLPPTLETATDTATKISNRRTDVKEADLFVLLNITELIFHEAYGKEKE